MSNNLTGAEIALSLPGGLTHEAFKLIEAHMGGDVTLTVTKSAFERLGREGDDPVPALSFAETQKKLQINKNRARALTALFGTKGPVGNKVKLDLDPDLGQIIILAAE